MTSSSAFPDPLLSRGHVVALHARTLGCAIALVRFHAALAADVTDVPDGPTALTPSRLRRAALTLGDPHALRKGRLLRGRETRARGGRTAIGAEATHRAARGAVGAPAIDGSDVRARALGGEARAVTLQAPLFRRARVAVAFYSGLFDAVYATSSHRQDRPLRSLQSAQAVLTNPANPLR